MQRMGHWGLQLDTPNDDPSYLRMLEAEKRWLRVNPELSDIYTLRRQADGNTTLIVDAGTDLAMPSDGVRGRTTRAAIGEPIKPRSQLLQKAYSGLRDLDPSPVTDRWGTWITAYAPILDDSGKVEAVLAVNADATAWQEAIKAARQFMLYCLASVFVFLAIGEIIFSIRLLTRENQRQRRSSSQIEQSRSRLASIINSIDGVVWEWDASQNKFAFVSQQAREVLGVEAANLEHDAAEWHNHIHEDDLLATDEQRQMVLINGGNYSLDYRFVRPDDNRTIWVRERGVCLRDEEARALCLRGIFADITTSREHAEELEALNKQMAEASRQAGMAEVASGVLHNVGNVLNSVNVSSTVISDIVRESKVQTLSKLSQLLTSQEAQLTKFLTTDPRGQAVPKFIAQIARELESEQQLILKEMTGLAKNVTHIKQIVMMQQSFARTGGSTEPLDVLDMVDDAIRINESALVRHDIQLVRDFSSVPLALADRNKVLQILINLIRNAKHACTASGNPDRRITISIKSGDNDMVSIILADNGIGMSKATIERLFSYGFTTKKDGHGFGLHSGMNAAREMGGSLTARSDGPGFGSSFQLDLPIASTGTADSSISVTNGTQAETHLPTLPALEPSPVSTANRPRTRKLSRPEPALATADT
jgi:signal transduction histidine kinase